MSASIVVAKVLVVGDVATGKTSFIQRFCRGQFSSAYNTTIGVDFSLKSLHVDDQQVKMQLWDIAGQDRFKGLARIYYKDAAAALILYDTCDMRTFKSVMQWKEDINQKVLLPNGQPIPVFLIGTKIDLDETNRQVKTEEAQALCQEKEFADFFETSAKTNVGITEACTAVAQRILQDIKRTAPEKAAAAQAEEPTIRLSDRPAANVEEKSGCC